MGKVPKKLTLYNIHLLTKFKQEQINQQRAYNCLASKIVMKFY